MNRPTLEDILREIEGQSAMLRYLSECASAYARAPDPDVLNGMADALERITDRARSARRSLGAEVLSLEIDERCKEE